jgi:hypothetical protein
MFHPVPMIASIAYSDKRWAVLRFAAEAVSPG